MIIIDIPGYKNLAIEHVVFDVNGTLALDGKLLEGVRLLVQRLQQQVQVHLLTADTHGKQTAIDAVLGLEATIIRTPDEKAQYVKALGADQVVAIGNGANDVSMCEAAALSIAVLGPEGAAGSLVTTADVLVRDVRDALSMLLNPNRLRATLRR